MKVVRNRKLTIRLSEDELQRLNYVVSQSGMSKESYVRLLLKGYLPKGKPTEDYLEMIQELRRIGNNINQIAMIAHKTKNINDTKYLKIVNDLNKSISKIESINRTPSKIDNVL